jgi:hypothetical protein
MVTSSMSSTSNVSAVAVLLPLIAGAAGPLNLVQSERSSLVSGAAVGMLVAGWHRLREWLAWRSRWVDGTWL